MLRRFQNVNIPTDVIRTVVSVVELGSFGKAAERLGLSQPAISAQIKRLQALVGGDIFVRTAGGVELNERGRLLLPMFRRLLEINDHILHVSGSAEEPRQLRVGMSFMYAGPLFASNAFDQIRRMNIIADHSIDILRSLSDGYIDVCVVFQPSEQAGDILSRWPERLVWVRSRDFTLSPGSPVPIVGWPGFLGDQLAVKLLEQKGIPSRFSFSSFDSSCRVEAVTAGMGVMIVPSWAKPPGLVEANEYYLPSLPPMEGAIMKGHTVDLSQLKAVLPILQRLVRSPNGG